MSALALMLAGAIAQASPLAGAGEPIVFGRSFEIAAPEIGGVRRVNVLLPDGYEDPKRPNVRYPVLYLLDGGAGWQDWFHIAGLVHQGGTWGANAPVILVGIESKDRRSEFTAPSSDAKERSDFPTHGQSERFRRFLIDRLKPAVDRAYRTSGDDGLIGESLAGLFVVETALREGGAFDRYIAVSPSLWWDGERLSRDAAGLLAASSPPRRRLWLSIADEGGAMQSGMDRLTAALKANASPDLSWSFTPFPREKHSTVYHPAATRAIREVYTAPPSAKP